MIHPPIAPSRLVLATGLLLAIGLAGNSLAQTVLLDFTSAHCGPCQQLKPTIERLQAEGYPVRVVDVVQQQKLAQQFGVTRVPCLVMVANGREFQRLQGPASYDELRHLMQAAGVQLVKETREVQPRGQSPDTRPSLDESLSIPPSPAALRASGIVPLSAGSLPATPPKAAYVDPSDFEQRLLRSSVRIKVEDATGHSFGTGTIIDTVQGEALVITCGHLFRGESEKGTITIEIFEPTASGVQVAQRVQGTLRSFDLDRDIGLVSFRSPTPVTVARVASQPVDRVNDAAWSVGCDRGADPTVRSSRVTAIQRYHGPSNLETSGAPVEGRSGGGLFNSQGELVGVCFAADPQLDEGLYAAIPSIQQELDRLGLSRIYQQDRAQALSPPIAERRPTTLPLMNDPNAVVRGQTPESPLDTTSDGTIPPASFGAAPGYPTTPPPAATPNLGALAVPERAALEEIATRAAEGEVVCIIRPREPGGASEVIHLDRVSPEFLAALRQMQGSAAPR